MNECFGPNKCHSHYSICTDTPGSYTCQCKNGYRGDGVSCSSKFIEDFLHLCLFCWRRNVAIRSSIHCPNLPSTDFCLPCHLLHLPWRIFQDTKADIGLFFFFLFSFFKILTSAPTKAKPTTATAMQHVKTPMVLLLVIVMPGTKEQGQPAAVSECFYLPFVKSDDDKLPTVSLFVEMPGYICLTRHTRCPISVIVQNCNGRYVISTSSLPGSSKKFS